MRRSDITRGVLLALLSLPALAWGSDKLRTSAHATYEASQRYEDVYYLPPTPWLRVFALGWNEAVADLVWLRALVYFGDSFRHQGDAHFVFDYTEAILALDPRFQAAYRWVGMAGLYRPVGVRAEDIERAVAIMERGAVLFPEDGELAWDIGAALAFELTPLVSEEERPEAQRRAAPHLVRAVRLGSAPEWAALTNASLLARIGREEQAAEHLEDMYLSTSDPVMRERIANRVREMRSRAEANAFVEAMEQLEARRARELPYVPASLYLLVGPRPPVDLSEPIRIGIGRAALSSSAASEP